MSSSKGQLKQNFQQFDSCLIDLSTILMNENYDSILKITISTKQDDIIIILSTKETTHKNEIISDFINHFSISYLNTKFSSNLFTDFSYSDIEILKKYNNSLVSTDNTRHSIGVTDKIIEEDKLEIENLPELKHVFDKLNNMNEDRIFGLDLGIHGNANIFNIILSSTKIILDKNKFSTLQNELDSLYRFYALEFTNLPFIDLEETRLETGIRLVNVIIKKLRSFNNSETNVFISIWENLLHSFQWKRNRIKIDFKKDFAKNSYSNKMTVYNLYKDSVFFKNYNNCAIKKNNSGALIKISLSHSLPYSVADITNTQFRTFGDLLNKKIGGGKIKRILVIDSQEFSSKKNSEPSVEAYLKSKKCKCLFLNLAKLKLINPKSQFYLGYSYNNYLLKDWQNYLDGIIFIN